MDADRTQPIGVQGCKANERSALDQITLHVFSPLGRRPAGISPPGKEGLWVVSIFRQNQSGNHP
jgi:hypothetical protein